MTLGHPRSLGAMALATAPQTGIDLLVARREKGLTQSDVAIAMGVNRQRVSALERSFRPPQKAVERYLAALRQVAGP